MPYFSVGFARLVRFDRTHAILVCSGERILGRVSKVPTVEGGLVLLFSFLFNVRSQVWPIRNYYHVHVHLVDHSTRVGCSTFSAVLHRADESQPARNSCPRLPHSVDSRIGLYNVAVVLSFLRSPISLAEI